MDSVRGCDLLPAVDQPRQEVHQLKQVIDGDTVRLRNGRLVRLIGINAPEIGYNETPDQALAKEAREYLQQLLLGQKKVLLTYGARAQDRYGRELAHLLLPDGTNVQQLLLRAGLAFQISLPPNLRHNDCYARAQAEARNHNKGIWHLDAYRPTQVGQITAKQTGYQRITGRIERIGYSKKSVWLNMGKHFALRIQRQDLSYFKDWQLQDLSGKMVTVNGWIHPMKQQLVMLLRHPSALRIEPASPDH